MQDTSLLAYRKIQLTLGNKQEVVLRLIRAATRCGMDMTDFELAKALHWKINTVTPRRNELVKLGMVVKSQRRWNEETKTLNWAWKAKEA